MEIKQEQKDIIINCGGLGYDNERMSNILGIEISKIDNEMGNKKSEFYKLYLKGQHTAEYVIDLKLFDMARTGDIQALDKLEFRKATR